MKQYIKKNGQAIIELARYFMLMEVGTRVLTVDELSKKIACSVGYIAKSIKEIEAIGAIHLERQGRNGTIVKSINFKKLVELADFGRLVCAMPLPYTKRYEGLASAIKDQIDIVPLYFAHMRGADVRAECLKNGVYDIAIMSKLAAQSYIEEGTLQIAIELPVHSYVSEHKLIYKGDDRDSIKRIGVDPDSPDQKVLTEMIFKGRNVDIVAVPYNECLDKVNSNYIDATIWNPSSKSNEQYSSLRQEAISDLDNVDNFSIAVLMVRKDANFTKALLNHMLNIEELKSHQEQVISGSRTPTY
ncbi:GntR family transcriptional regulator YhfZ [Vibrio hippocampi]|uniref:Transcriptional regulator n=1 Tax=Vibrio hippocampi TaxID=654686 RepID=A0ABM8ZEF7_9VIBR|nr:GntR family transcriptional regulator YhfZ [Vibrio hippocampi]CAH0524897.1 hypothetical protein VHP8226_00572 [Vibrio hippocampi]